MRFQKKIKIRHKLIVKAKTQEYLKSGIMAGIMRKEYLSILNRHYID